MDTEELAYVITLHDVIIASYISDVMARSRHSFVVQGIAFSSDRSVMSGTPTEGIIPLVVIWATC